MGTYQANIFGKKRTKSVDFGESGKMQFWSPNSYLVQEKNGGGTLHEIIGNSFTRPNLTLFYHQKMGRSKKKVVSLLLSCLLFLKDQYPFMHYNGKINRRPPPERVDPNPQNFNSLTLTTTTTTQLQKNTGFKGFSNWRFGDLKVLCKI